MRNINSQYTISVEKDSNKIIGSSEEKFGGIREGSLIKIGEDDNLYTIIGRENHFYIRDFTLKDNKTIVIDENIGINLQSGDTLKITYKEWEALIILNILNQGKGYELETDLFIDGGVCDINISTGISNPTVLKITEIGDDGSIKQLGIKNKGKYLSAPTNPCKIISNSGNDGLVELKYSECDDRTITERIITNIYFKENKSYIVLNYSLPLKLIKGKFSVEKACLLISPNFFDDTKISTGYSIIKDFTPTYQFPLMAKNSISQDIIYNKMCLKNDGKLKNLEDRIKELEKKING